MALAWQSMQLPLSNGLQQKYDARARPMPALDICRDAQFDELGGLQTRHPFAATSNAIYGGGTLANCRRIVANGDELLVFTSDNLYSWSPTLAKWVLKGTHLAVAVTETPHFVTPGDQIDPDRAELNGTVIQTWCEATTGYAAAYDKVSGAVLMPPKVLSTGVARVRVTALSTRILLTFIASGTTLFGVSVDPADPVTSFSVLATSLFVAGAGAVYDVARIGSTDTAFVACRRTPTTSYQALKVTSALAVTSAAIARTCDGPIAVAVEPGATNAQVIRGNGTNIESDLILLSSLATVGGAVVVGTATSATINQITAAYANATTAYAFWTSGTVGETSSFTDFTVKTNSVTSAGIVGAQSVLRHQLGIASHAFAYNGHVYLWLAFASDSGTSALGNTSVVRAQLQNTYFLYREDTVLVSRCLMSIGGGFSPSTSQLPSVAAVGVLGTEFAWCATSRRIIEVGAQAEHTGFSARAPRDVVFAFDSDAARRCARLGQTLYVSGGGIPLQYDGVQLAEIGFLIYPWYFEPQLGGAGNLGAGTYTWKATLQWLNGQGEVDRSTTATGMSLTIAASKFVFLNYQYLNVTLKIGARPPAIYMWRTAVSPTFDAPFYLVTSQDPNAGIVDNGYVVNVDTAAASTPLPDNFADATLTTKEVNPENGSVLEFLAPPAASIVKATDTRVFLAGISGDPDRVWYSRLRGAGEVASFHDSLTIDVPRVGGDITGIDFLNDTLVVFRETAIYAYGGDGFDNTGGGQNYGPARIVTTDIGAVTPESIVLAPMGLVFKSQKGWYLCDPGWSTKYIGAPVAAFDSETILSIHIVETQHQIRALSSARMLVWDYFANQWCEWTITDGLHSTIWNGTHVYLTTTGPKQQLTSYTGVNYGMDAELTWIKPADLQGSVAVRWFEILGEYRSSCRVRMRVARDYQYDGAGNPVYFDDVSWAPSPTVVGSALQVRHAPTVQKVEAFKVRITAVADGNPATLDATTMNVLTSGAVWNTVFVAFADGTQGNAVTMSIVFEDAPAPFVIDVRDHFTWNHSLQRWVEDLNNVGVRVLCRTGSSPTVSQLEIGIQGATALVDINTPDTTPSKIVNATAMANLTRTGSFTGGTYVAPTGEAIKLTGLGLEIGSKPGLFRRLPAAQKA